MKHYQLTAWPDLSAPFQRMAYRRMLHQMSQRPMSLDDLTRHSGLERGAVQRFIDALAAHQVLSEREPTTVSLQGRFKAMLSASMRHV